MRGWDDVKSPAERRTAIATKTLFPKLTLSHLERLILTSLDQNKAEQIVSVDLTGKADFADRMVVANGTSQRHVAALADRLVGVLKSVGFDHVPVEGKETGDWVLIDAGDIVVHLFKPEVRSYYNLEKMWSVAIPEREAVY